MDHARGQVRDQHGEQHGPFDLIVVADGAASRLRAATGPAKIDRPYPWGALWCLLPAGDWPALSELRQRYVAARKMVGLLPVGTSPGDDTRRLSFFWSLPADGFDAWQTAGLAAWQSELHQLWPEAGAVVSGIADAGQLARARYRDTTQPQWHRDRVVLVGDSAHAMSPQLGQGVNMALLDAAVLTQALGEHGAIGDALAAYQRQRRAHVWIYQMWSRWLTPLFQSEHDTIAKLRDVAFLPMGKLPGGRGQMLRVLTGTQHGLFGKLGLDPDFLQAL